MAIAQAESHCRADAYNGANSNGTNDAGVFQINSIHVNSGLIADKDRYNVSKNVQAAYSIYSSSSWRAWAVFNNNSYLNYLGG